MTREIYMRISNLVLILVLVVGSAFSQQRVLLSPYDEAIPVEKGQSALHVIMKSKIATGASVMTQPCPPGVNVGVVPGNINTNFGFFYGDVAAMIYVAPFRGVIESVYFMSYGEVANPDSTAL